MSKIIEERRKKTLFLTQFSLLLAIEAIVCFTPLGSIPIGPLVATLSHVPVIITAITLGTGAGTLMGFFFGLFSFLYWTFNPGVTSFVFTPFYTIGEFGGSVWSIVICFVPRILLGLFSGLVFSALHKLFDGKKADAVSYVASGIVGSLTNTVLVLGGIYLFFGREYAAANGLAYEALIGAMMAVIGSNGLLEMAVAAVIAFAVCLPVRKYFLKLH
ncbi:MAG: ECF transporter S component [Lachnospiraceae bacterium]|nr:ECF transporter S component [Lachnospiraceae bacterium]